MTTSKTYRGWLVEGWNGETETLNLKDDLFHHRDGEILADTITGHINRYGDNLTVRYFIVDKEVSKQELEENLVKQVMGIGDASYCMRYSDITGYLWTDEDLVVGGHDLMAELRGNIGKFLHMEIEYNE